MADVQTNIIGNCLCVLGDSMAMPVGSMIEKFRPEFEAHIERARRRNGGLPLVAHGGRADEAVGSPAA
jgi:NADH-quinone oxidoreductase subunit F